MAMNTAVKRLRKEAQQQESSKDDYIKLQPNTAQDNLFAWRCLLRAPPDSVYQGYVFVLDIEIPEQYPLLPPVIRFNAQTPIFHPNVLFTSGEICLDILKKEWTPAWSLQSAVRAISALMSDPAADSPLNCDAGNMVRAGDDAAFRSMARMYCEEFALKSDQFNLPIPW